MSMRNQLASSETENTVPVPVCTCRAAGDSMTRNGLIELLPETIEHQFLRYKSVARLSCRECDAFAEDVSGCEG
ncbi:hypothetical protein HYFRA_00003376 [Hymenoscyphus fraxineus]|uniref:Uncharacterized protein n=1 Tax=Hymenoscyphus fraxineus TaxID=746836 RepID=A0A9N9KW36_9HELO|nr:hypothetical protein HYFRA_00003376 [Hymenoscyphus fraxineus]